MSQNKNPQWVFSYPNPLFSPHSLSSFFSASFSSSSFSSLPPPGFTPSARCRRRPRSPSLSLSLPRAPVPPPSSPSPAAAAFSSLSPSCCRRSLSHFFAAASLTRHRRRRLEGANPAPSWADLAPLRPDRAGDRGMPAVAGVVWAEEAEAQVESSPGHCHRLHHGSRARR